MERESFIFYRSFYEAIQDLDAEQTRELVVAMCERALNWNDIETKWVVKIAYNLIRPQLDANTKRYVDWCKGWQYWHLWWAPEGNSNAVKNWEKVSKQPHRGSKDNPTGVIKTTPNDNDNVNDNGNGNVNENEKETNRLPANAGRETVEKKNIKSEVCSLIHIQWETEEERLELDEAWKAYKEMRKKIKKPLTEYAEKLRANDLVKLWATTKERIAILNQSTASWWQDLYELKDKPRTKLKWNMYH